MIIKLISVKRAICLCLFLLTGFLAGCGHRLVPGGEELSTVFSDEDREAAGPEEGSSSSLTSLEEAGEIYVHVCGCVKKPGLYCLKSGDRVSHAIEAAGGFTGKADSDAWNLAAPLTDGMQVCVPAKGEKDTDADGGSGLTSSGEGRVNINSASLEALTSLKGIGESRAADIIAYRNENGPFTAIEEIKNVPGIGDGIFDRIKDSITVS